MGALIQLLGSAVAVALLVALAAWARIARATPPLDDAAARALFADEFPGRALDAVWVASDGKGGLARSGDLALTLYRAGDGYVARSLAWSVAASATSKDGAVSLPTGDIAAPQVRLALEPWPA